MVIEAPANSDGQAAKPGPSVLFEDGKTDISDVGWLDAPGFIVFWTLAIIVFLQFFTRYVLNDSLAWTEEIARYVLILAAFTGAMTVSRKGTHIFLEFFYRYIPAKAGKVLSILVECISGLFFGYLAWVGVELALQTKTKMASAEIPKSLLYWAVAACLAVMAIHSAIWVIRKLRQDAGDVIRDIEQHSMADLAD